MRSWTGSSVVKRCRMSGIGAPCLGCPSWTNEGARDGHRHADDLLRKHLSEPCGQETLLGTRGGERERPLVGDTRLRVAAEPPEQRGACGVEVAVPVEVERVEDREAGLRPRGLGNGDRAVEINDGRWRDTGERLVEQHDLLPIAR